MEDGDNKEVNTMKMLLILNKDEEEIVSSVFSLAMTASASGEEVSIFAIGSGTTIFTKEKAALVNCCGLSVNDLIGQNGKVRVCLCIESKMCNINVNEVIEGVEVVDILELMQMIREYEKIITF